MNITQSGLKLSLVTHDKIDGPQDRDTLEMGVQLVYHQRVKTEGLEGREMYKWIRGIV